MMTERNNPKGTRGLEIERVFESSRLAGELIACAYENLVPIKRHLFNSAQEVELSEKPPMEGQRCAVGM